MIRTEIAISAADFTVGDERTDTDYRFLPFDVQVGHEELLVLWDDQVTGENVKFTAAVQKATSQLTTTADRTCPSAHWSCLVTPRNPPWTPPSALPWPPTAPPRAASAHSVRGCGIPASRARTSVSR